MAKIEKNSFVNANKLVFFSARVSDIKMLPENLFEHAPNLKSILLGANLIGTVHESAFKGLRNLTKLELWYNKIRVLHKNTFSDLESLQELNLQGNQIEVLGKDLFKSNKKLLTLYLNSNRIHEIDPHVFSHLTNLRELDLLDNDCIGIREKFTFNSIMTVFKENSVNCLRDVHVKCVERENKIYSLHLEKKNLEVKIEELKNINRQLQEQIFSRNEKMNLLSNENSELRNERRAMKDKKIAYKSNESDENLIKDLSKSIETNATLDAKNAIKFNAINEELKKSNQFLRQQITKTNEKIQNLSNDNSQLKNEITKLNQKDEENTRTIKLFKDQLDGNSTKLLEKVKLLVDKNGALENKVGTLQNKNFKLKEEMKELLKKLEKLISSS